MPLGHGDLRSQELAALWKDAYRDASGTAQLAKRKNVDRCSIGSSRKIDSDARSFCLCFPLAVSRYCCDIRTTLTYLY